MQLIAIVALLAASASAAPGAISERQTSGSVRARFYSENSCGGNGARPAQAELTLQANDVVGRAGCRDLTIGPYPATYFDQSSLTKKIRVFNVPCSQVGQNLDQGNWIDIGPGNKNIEQPNNGCKTLSIRSYLTFP